MPVAAKLLRILSPLLLACLIAGPLAAADGDLDPGFGNVLPGRSYLPPLATLGTGMLASAVAVDGQGRVVLAGNGYNTFNGAPLVYLPVLLRLDAQGFADPSFQATGLPADAERRLNAVAVLANNEVWIAGGHRSAAGMHPYIARFASNGTMLCSRTQMLGAAGSPVPAEAQALAVLPDGRLMVAGAASGDVFWARFNANCTLDGTYALGGARIVGLEALAGGPSQEYASALVVAPNGRIYTAASSNLGRPGNYDMLVFCEQANGSACPNWFLGFATIAFDRPNSTSKDDRAAAIALDRQGRVLVAGHANWAGLDDDFAIARLLSANGALDADFGSGGRLTVAFDLGDNLGDRATGMAVQSDGRILMAGIARRAALSSDFAFVRLSANGLPDSSFGAGGKRVHNFEGTGRWDHAFGMVLSAGRVLAAGRVRGSGANGGGMGVARLQSDLIFADGLQ